MTTTTNATTIGMAIVTITCKVCGEKRIVKSGERNIKCRLCGQTLHVQLKPDHGNYIKGLNMTASGNDTYDINDQTAIFFRGLDVIEVIDLGASLLREIPAEFRFSAKMNKNFAKFEGNIEEFFEAKYEELNVGMVRMNVGNICRAALKRQAGL